MNFFMLNKRMLQKDKVTQRKINKTTSGNLFIYHVVLFLTIFLLELAVLVLYRQNFFNTGKVGTSFRSQLEILLPILIPYLVPLIFLMISIYIFFAWGNFQIWSFFSRKNHKRINNNIQDLNYVDIIIFCLLNFLFFFIAYIFNSLLYPASVHSFHSLANKTPQYAPIVFSFIVFIYFGLLLFSLKKLNKNKAFLFLISILILGTIFNHIFIFYAKHKLITQNNNKGNNIIIIGIDSLRYDFLKKDVVPNIYNFIHQSIYFPNAFTPLARTYPSWMSLLTGKYPSHSGIRYNLINRELINQHNITLSSYLKNEQNYYTVHAIDESRFCNIKIADGFDKLIHPVTGAPDFVLGKFHDFVLFNLFLNNRFGRMLFPIVNRNRAIAYFYDGSVFVEDLLLELNELKKKDHFFLAVHFCMPHWPFLSGGIGKGNFGDNWLSAERRYELMLRKADKQFKELLDGIKQRGLLDNSLIIVMSDHGESFYPFWGHGTNLLDLAQNRIVLSVKPPNYRSVPKVCENNVSLVDIYPTILSLLQLPYPSDYRLDGTNMLDKKNHSHRLIFLETGFHLFHENGNGFTLKEMIEQGLEYYEADKATGLITVRKKFHDSILRSKQIGVIQDDWLLVCQRNNPRKKYELIRWNEKKIMASSKENKIIPNLKVAIDKYLE